MPGNPTRIVTSEKPDFSWVIIGGGIHGVHSAVRLIGSAGVDPERVRIVDPGPALLHTWSRCTLNTGMEFLRSPAVHNLDLEPWSLLSFADSMPELPGAGPMFTAPHRRPSLALFQAHCRDVIERFGLADLHVRDRAVGISLDRDEANIRLEGGGHLATEHVVLALGAGDHLRCPEWTDRMRESGARVSHVFAPGFELIPDDWPQRVAVVGGGITAVQVGLLLVEAKREVHLVSRHPVREHQFDSDPGWLGPRNMLEYARIEDPNRRRRKITAARHVGSLPPALHRLMRDAVRLGLMQRHEGPVEGSMDGDEIVLKAGDEEVRVDGVLLATGFERRRPGGRFIDRLIDDHGLPCASCGFPIVGRDLRWHSRVFVTGPLAELEIGPVSRNIAGARRAADRIVAAARAVERSPAPQGTPSAAP